VVVLVTGGAGYIGSHTVVELIKAGVTPIIVDNLVNSQRETVDKIAKITRSRPKFYEQDLLDITALEAIFLTEKIDAVIHFAALKAVGESVSKPLDYYCNNLIATLNLLQVMQKYAVKNLINSSSATVYGNVAKNPITEDFPLATTNPYGTTKLMVENLLLDVCKANPQLNVINLRYFNPVGAHASGLIGESPAGIPNNLMPYITKVATRELAYLNVFGDNYQTPDGTGVRDYVHVVDLALGHLQALNKIADKPGFTTYNLGTGTGYSVLELVRAFEIATNLPIPYKIVKPRPGDIATCYANPAKAQAELDWQAKFKIEQMCQDAWRFALGQSELTRLKTSIVTGSGKKM